MVRPDIETPRRVHRSYVNLQNKPTSRPPDVNSLPPETLAFAERMFEAARSGQGDLLLQAIDAGLPVNLTNHKGNTLLMLAAYTGHVNLTKELLQRGADVDRLNDSGQSIISGAVFKGYDEIVQVLMAENADPRIGTPTAIHTALMFGKDRMLDVLGATEEDRRADVPKPVASSEL